MTRTQMSTTPQHTPFSGLFVTLEGGEGSGKSTLSRNLRQVLLDKGFRVRLTREPGGCEFAEQIRQILTQPSLHDLDARSELLLFAAARAQHVATVIRPALEAGEIVICDRFSDSSLVYQGAGRQLDAATITQINRFATDALTPHVTFILDLDVKIGLRRAIQRLADADTDESRFETENLDFHERVREGFQTLARVEPERCCVLNGAATEEQLCTAAVMEILARVDYAARGAKVG